MDPERNTCECRGICREHDSTCEVTAAQAGGLHEMAKDGLDPARMCWRCASRVSELDGWEIGVALNWPECFRADGL